MKIEPSIQMISIELIIPNRFQPRLTFDENGLNELAASIKEHGIIQPLVLRRLGDKYEIIAGERRYKAATIAGLTEVPAIISNLDDNQSAEVALVENVQRRDLSSIEEAKSYKKILDKGYLTQDQLAKRMGITQSTVANKLRLLNLTEDVQEALMNEKISERHARSLLALATPEKQRNMLLKIINERLTVRQLDEEIKKEVNPAALLNSKKEEGAPMNSDVFNPMFSPNTENNNLSSIETFNLDDTPTSLEKVNDLMEEFKLETLDFGEDINPNIDHIKESASDIIPKNNMLNFFDKTEYPSLEDEVVNMAIDTNGALNFNPFSDKEENTKPEKLTELDIPDSISTSIIPPKTNVKEENKPRIIDLSSVSTAYDELEKEIKSAGFKINTESFDFEDLYQIIIKIDKTSN